MAKLFENSGGEGWGGGGGGVGGGWGGAGMGCGCLQNSRFFVGYGTEMNATLESGYYGGTKGTRYTD